MFLVSYDKLLALLNLNDFNNILLYLLFDLCPLLSRFLISGKANKKLFRCKAHVSDQCFLLFCIIHITLTEGQSQPSMINVGFRLTNFKMLRDRWNKCGGKLFLNWYFFLDTIPFSFFSHLSAWLTSNIEAKENIRVPIYINFWNPKQMKISKVKVITKKKRI